MFRVYVNLPEGNRFNRYIIIYLNRLKNTSASLTSDGIDLINEDDARRLQRGYITFFFWGGVHPNMERPIMSYPMVDSIKQYIYIYYVVLHISIIYLQYVYLNMYIYIYIVIYKCMIICNILYVIYNM